MPTHHNRKPVYQKATSPGDVNVTDLADHVFQWNEAGSKPVEVQMGLTAWMPPIENPGDIVVWSDSNTLGYGFIPNAPMFWSDGGAGQTKILQMINHVAGRKSGLSFSDYNTAVAWILDQTDIYTNLTNTLQVILAAGGNQTLTINNNTTRPLVRIGLEGGPGGGKYFTPEYPDGSINHTEVDWLPIPPGGSIKFYGLSAYTGHGYVGTGTTAKITIDAYWDMSETKTIETLVNGEQGDPFGGSSTSSGASFAVSRGVYPGTSLITGDDIIVNFNA